MLKMYLNQMIKGSKDKVCRWELYWLFRRFRIWKPL